MRYIPYLSLSVDKYVYELIVLFACVVCRIFIVVQNRKKNKRETNCSLVKSKENLDIYFVINSMTMVMMSMLLNSVLLLDHRNVCKYN